MKVTLGPFRAILFIALVAGTLDITENLVFNLLRHVTPWQVFQYIASGLIGLRAFRLGWDSVALGVVVHYLIALGWTTLFYLVGRNAPLVVRRPVLAGAVYGCVVYLVMTFLVLPHTGVPHARAAITIASRVSGPRAHLLHRVAGGLSHPARDSSASLTSKGLAPPP